MQCLEKARECFETLSSLLASGRHKYAIDNTPSSLDALLFGTLACILMPTENDIPDRELANLLLNYEGLCRLVNVIAEEHFGEIYGSGEHFTKDSSGRPMSIEQVDSLHQQEEDARKEQAKRRAEKAAQQVSIYRPRKIWFWSLLTFAGMLWAYANRNQFLILALQMAGGEIRLASDGQSFEVQPATPMADTGPWSLVYSDDESE